MTDVKLRTVVAFREAEEEDRAAWVRMSEFTRVYPNWLPYLKQTDDKLYGKITAGLQTLHIEGRTESWRDPREGHGGRPSQLIPGSPGAASDRTDWAVWLLMGGRGSGKSRTGAEAIRELLFGRQWQTNPIVALVGQTMDSVITDMVVNTLLEVLPLGSVLKWNVSKCELRVDLGMMRQNDGTMKRRIARIKGYSSEAARKLRGPNFHLAWCDEIATWADKNRSPNAPSTTWSNMKLAVRLDDSPRNSTVKGTWKPRIIATTTPASVNLIRNADEHDVLNSGKGLYDDPKTVISHMTTLENEANLSTDYYENVIEPLKGTRLYNQEVLGELMDEAIGAQWNGELVSSMTYPAEWPISQAGGIKRVVIAVDPSIGGGFGDECGIVVSALCADDRAYVLADLSVRARASRWCAIVADAYVKYGASAVVVESNQGGELVEETLGRYAPNLPVVSIWAKEGKLVRAEPVALLSDRDLVRFAGGENPLENPFAKLQRQMTTWEGDGPSPDRLDAFVYSILYLLPASTGAATLISVVRSGSRTKGKHLAGIT